MAGWVIDIIAVNGGCGSSDFVYLFTKFCIGFWLHVGACNTIAGVCQGIILPAAGNLSTLLSGDT